MWIRIQEHGKKQKFYNKPSFLPFKKASVPSKSDQDPVGMNTHWFGTLDPDLDPR
jgi:hypothetical protein